MLNLWFQKWSKVPWLCEWDFLSVVNRHKRQFAIGMCRKRIQIWRWVTLLRVFGLCVCQFRLWKWLISKGKDPNIFIFWLKKCLFEQVISVRMSILSQTTFFEAEIILYDLAGSEWISSIFCDDLYYKLC